MTPVIIDTSGILVLLDEDHPDHARLASQVRSQQWELVVSPLVIAEADYMIATRLGTAAATEFANDVVAGAYKLASWSTDDHSAAVAVSSHYHDYIGLADAANVVLAARFRTDLIVTLDYRHFRALRPLGPGKSFTLIPADWPY